MSSILKALQRLQGDRGEGALPEPQPALGDELARELAQGPASPPEPTPLLSRARLTLIGVGAAAALLATAGLGWWLARGPAEAPPLAESAAPPLARAEPPPEPDPPSGTLRRARPARPSAAPEEAPTLPASVVPHGEAPAEVAEAAEAPAEPAAARAAAVPPAAAPRPAPAAAMEMGEAPAVPAQAAVVPPRTLLAEETRSGAAPGAKPAEAPRIELVGEAPERAAGASARTEPAAAPPVAAAPRAEPRDRLAPPAVEVLRTTWHPKPERRVARLRIAGFAAPLEVREGDAVSTLVVKTIEPSGVLFLHGGEELRRDIGKR